MAGERHYVWDLPTRLFHWLLVGLIGFSWWSAENHHLDWHRYSGSAVVGLLIFRILWGLLGSSTARFAQFVKGPRAVRDYLRGGDESPGHSPLGALSVIALLVLLAVQVGSGLFAVDVDGLESGPLAHLIDFDQGRLAAAIHHTSFNILLALIALHLFAILFYLLARRRNLTGAMVTGYRKGRGESTAAVKPWRLAVALAPALLAAWWLASQAPY